MYFDCNDRRSLHFLTQSDAIFLLFFKNKFWKEHAKVILELSDQIKLKTNEL